MGRLDAREVRWFSMCVKNRIGSATTLTVLLLLLATRVEGQATPAACRGKSLPRFEDHPAAAGYDGKAHAPILATALDHKYRTLIRTTASQGPNFAKHFSAVRWGLGTGIKGFVIVDLETGIVYDPPFEGVGLDVRRKGSLPWEPPSEWQCYADILNYHPESTLFVVEGCLLGRATRSGRTYFVMQNGALEQVAYDADR